MARESRVMESTFRYQPLETPETIRVLRFLPESTPDDVHLTMEHIADCFNESSWPSGDRYTALSYCWGDPLVKKPITLNGCPFLLTENLWDALRELNNDELEGNEGRTTRYWIDAVCINQEDLDERSAQVSIMWRIYATAEPVVAWVGRADDQTALVYEMFEGLWDRLDDQYRGTKISSHEANALARFLERDYFQRTWIILECVRASHLHIRCGGYSYDVRALLHPALEGLLRAVISDNVVSKLLPALNVLAARRTAMQINDRPGRDPDNSYFASIEGHLYIFYKSKCSNRKDKIFAMLGLPLIQMWEHVARFKPDYNLTNFDVAMNFLGYCFQLSQSHAEANSVSGANLSCVIGHIGIMILSLDRALELDSRMYRFTAHDRPRLRIDLNNKRCIMLDNGDEIDCTDAWWDDLLNGSNVAPFYEGDADDTRTHDDAEL